MLENVKITKLENGARVATSEMKGSKVCHLGFHIPMGSRREKMSEAGWSHFAEHMVLQGSEKYPSGKIVNHIMGRFGGKYNAETSTLWTTFYAHVPAYGVNTVIDVLGDALVHPLFSQEEIEKERKVVLVEMKRNEDEPVNRLYDMVKDGLWPNHPIHRPIIGTEKSITAIDAESLKAFHRARYTSSGAMFIAAGKVDHDEIVELVRPMFDNLSHVREAKYRTMSVDWPIKPFAVEYCDNVQASFMIAFRSVARSDPRQYAQNLLASILGGGSESRLYQSIRERHRLAYSVGAFASGYTDYGEFYVYADVSPKSLEKAMAFCGHELMSLVRKPIGRQDLAFMKEKFASLFVIINEPHSECEYDLLERSLKSFKKVIDIEEDVNRIRNISSGELHALAGEIFRPENCCLALRLPRDCKVSPEKLRESIFNG